MVKYSRFSTLPSEIPLTKQKKSAKQKDKENGREDNSKQEIKHASEK